MDKIKKVIICGLGAIGSIYASKISEAQDVELSVLVDEERFRTYQAQPLVFNDKEYFFHYIKPNDLHDKADLIIIATKNSGLITAVNNVKNFVGNNTIIMSLLNGIESEETIASSYGWVNVPYSYFVGHTSSRNGRNVNHDGVGKIVFGGSSESNILKIKELFERTGIEYEIPHDIDYSRWYKFMLNVGTNQASAILGASYEVFQNSENAMNVAVNFMKEVEKIAVKAGIKNYQNMLPDAVATIHSMLPETKSSMLQDVEAKRKTEVEIFSGTVIKLGKKYGIPTPYNQTAFEIISAIDEINSLPLNCETFK